MKPIEQEVVWSSDVQHEADITERSLILSSKLAVAGYVPGNILTSVDESVREVSASLRVEMPAGYEQRIIPVPFEKVLFSKIIGGANRAFPAHSHDQVDGFTMVLKGSLRVNGRELSVGDWFYAPAGCKYECIAGASGVELLHEYAPPPTIS